MARRWNGFLAQNQEIKDQWGVLEENHSQIEARLVTLANEEDPELDSDSDPDDEPVYIEVN